MRRVGLVLSICACLWGPVLMDLRARAGDTVPVGHRLTTQAQPIDPIAVGQRLTTQAQSGDPVTGVYRLTTQAQPGLCLDVTNSGNVSGTSVQLWAAGHTSNQQWLVEAQSDGTYKIYAFSGQNSLQMLDNAGGSYATTVHTWEDLAVDGQSDTNQRWYFVDMGSGYYRIVPAAGGKGGAQTLDIGQGDPGAGQGRTTDIWTYYGGGNQLFKLDWSGPSQVLPNPKKGLPCVPASYVTNAAGLHCSWIYNWSYGTPSNLPTGIEYVPMVWGWSGDTNIGSEVLAADPGMKNVLGFNEPDEPYSAGGSNMDVPTALNGFQYVSALKAQGINVGGPACAVDTDAWMSSFMNQAVNPPYNYNMDFIGLHLYVGGASGTDAAYSLLGFIDTVYSKYNKPLWVTEFAPTGLSSAEALTFIRIACQGMNARASVQRYSMFTSEGVATSGTGTSALINSDGTYTAAGKLYVRM